MFRLIGAGVLGVAVLLNIVGVATKGWIVTPYGELGLFISEINANVAAAFNLMGDIALIAAIVLACLSHTKNTEGTQGKYGGIVGLIGGILILVGIGNYTRAYAAAIGYATFGYSFGLVWTSFVLAMVGGGLASKND